MAGSIYLMHTRVHPFFHDNIVHPASNDGANHRQLSLVQFIDPKSVTLRDNVGLDAPPPAISPNLSSAAPFDVAPYSVENALLAIKAFRYQAFFFVYDAQSDEFVVIHNIRECDFGCLRIYRIASIISFALRKNFPERFQGLQQQEKQAAGAPNDGSSDLVFLLSTGDIPRIRQSCLFHEKKCKSDKFAPILQFGSVFVDKIYLPSMIAMPQPVRPHITCFDEWQLKGTICDDLKPQINPLEGGSGFQNGLVFGDSLGLTWESLVPQIIWRGTDFVFLHTMFPDMRGPDIAVDVEPKLGKFGNDARGVINALWDMGDDALLPRWRGVLLTSEAELEAKESNNPLPWVNIKFTSGNVKGIKTPTSQIEEYQRLEQLGITAIGESMSMVDQAKYKYHIDLGGGVSDWSRFLPKVLSFFVCSFDSATNALPFHWQRAIFGNNLSNFFHRILFCHSEKHNNSNCIHYQKGGTTWTGTIEKLALPGVLFHHMTPSKDWFHDRLLPWVHFIPVESDLSDLREKFEWAEAHPEDAKDIADNATEFAKMMGTPEGFSVLYNDHMRVPLQRVINAYRPQPKGGPVLSILGENGGDNLAVVARCSGHHADSCIRLDGLQSDPPEDL